MKLSYLPENSTINYWDESVYKPFLVLFSLVLFDKPASGAEVFGSSLADGNVSWLF